MDRYSILASQNAAGPQPVSAKTENAESPKTSEPLRFPGDDGGRSLSEMAQRDLTAALQLLAERAQYITGASGAAVALRVGDEMICRASAGSSAPELGAHLQVDSGLSGESVRTKQILRCDDAESDSRVNRESCRALDIASVMVMPLIREPEVIGVFELFSGRVNAFEERDTLALQRIAEMILTAVDHAEAAERAGKEISAEVKDPEVVVETITEKKASEEPAPKAPIEAKTIPSVADMSQTPEPPTPLPTPERIIIHKCGKCGFPVSEGRLLCLDCEAAEAREGKPAPPPLQTDDFVPTFGGTGITEESWLRSHWYFLVIAVIGAIVVGVLLRLR
jgi:hypothetical protein